MKFEIDREKYIDSGLVDEKQHPNFPLLIYNYTPACQFSRSWDEVTVLCRGLIVHKDTREIVARPFMKFFNYEEHVEKGDVMPDEIPIVYTKMDGSLGILYYFDDNWHVSTRGSFLSDQAKWATEYIKKFDLTGLNPDWTYLFEIIYPDNRIVVSYGSLTAMVLLAVIERETGKSLNLQQLHIPMGLMSSSSQRFSSFEELKGLNTKNQEGFVIHYPESDFRVKIKFEDYVKLHKVITGLSQIGIWEMLRDGKDLIQIIGDTPDEMHDWIQEVVSEILEKFVDIERQATQVELAVKNFETRKEQAKYILENTKYSGIVFAMLDGKDYKPDLWRMVRPRGVATFRRDIDA